MRQRKDLRPYQEGAVDFVKRTKRCALFVDPGLGKTATTLTVFIELIDNLELCETVLIVAPPRVAKETWPREFAEWAHAHDKSFVHIKGTPEQRRKLLKRKACFHIISIENLIWLLLELGGDTPRYEKNADGDQVKVTGSKWKSPPVMPYGAIVIDESSKVKNQDTNRWRALRMMAFMAEYFVLLTGTPASNGLHDLWAQIYLIDGGHRLGHTLTAFRERWFVAGFNGHGYKALGHAQQVIEGLIADIVFTLREEDYANLPPRMYNNIVLNFEPKTEKQYKTFERKLILEVEGDGKDIVANDGAAITNKLLQLANGTVYRTEQDETKTEHTFHDLKLDAMEELVEGLSGQTLLVAYTFKSDARRILARFKDARMLDKRSQTQDEWNRGEIPILLVHPQSAAHGLNLQHGGNNILWFGPTWSLENYIQLNKRLHRSGQKKPVMVHHLLIAGTMDEAVMTSLDDKNNVQETLLNLLKERIRSYKNG